ncbi:MAG: N-acetyltransferase [Bacteroidota bacterium]
MIQYATQKDLDKIADCHVSAFPDSVTSLLGKKVVASMLQWYLSAPNKFLFFMEENNKVVGYCGGFILDGSDAYGSGSGMTQFGFSTAVTSFLRKPWLLFHPEIRKKYKFILTNIKRKLGLKKEHPMVNVQPVQYTGPLMAGLVVIGVRPDLQQKGLGSKLQEEFERKAKEMGAEQLQLSVRTKNERAINSYKRNGYSVNSENETSYIMLKPLN